MLSAAHQDHCLLHFSRKPSLLPSVRKLEKPKLHPSHEIGRGVPHSHQHQDASKNSSPGAHRH